MRTSDFAISQKRHGNRTENIKMLIKQQIEEQTFRASKIRRFKTGNNHSSYGNSVVNPLAKARKLVELSTFLPSINNSRETQLHSRRNSHNSQYFQQTSGIDTESEVAEHLHECQIIIQNLKKLTNMSVRKINGLKDKFNRNYPSKHRYRRDNENEETEGNDFVERQPSFFGPIEKINNKNSSIQLGLSKKRGVLNTGHLKYGKLFDEPVEETKRHSSNKPRLMGDKRTTTLQMDRIQPQTHVSSNKEDDYQYQESEDQGEDTIMPTNNQQSHIKDINKENLDGSREESIEKVKQHQEREPSSLHQPTNSSDAREQQINNHVHSEQSKRRQKMLLKFLGHARSRGSELHKKIQLKIKNNCSLLLPNKRKAKIIQTELKQESRQAHQENPEVNNDMSANEIKGINRKPDQPEESTNISVFHPDVKEYQQKVQIKEDEDQRIVGLAKSIGEQADHAQQSALQNESKNQSEQVNEQNEQAAPIEGIVKALASQHAQPNAQVIQQQ